MNCASCWPMQRLGLGLLAGFASSWTGNKPMRSCGMTLKNAKTITSQTYGMTRKTTKVQAAHDKAKAKVAALWNQSTEAQRAVRAKFYPLERAAELNLRAAREALETAELAQAGFIVGKTVVNFNGRLWGFGIDRRGYAELIPLTNDGYRHKCRNEEGVPCRERMYVMQTMEMKERTE
jgi:hypothetical protein